MMLLLTVPCIAWEFSMQVVLVILHVVGKFLAPIGINRLLRYVELALLGRMLFDTSVFTVISKRMVKEH